jgi:hypothetical protein
MSRGPAPTVARGSRLTRIRHRLRGARARGGLPGSPPGAGGRLLDLHHPPTS